jgi:hypothetical protein
MTEASIQAVEKKLSKRVNFEFVQAPLPEAINFIQQITEVNIILDPACRLEGQKEITLKADAMPVGEALDKILDLAGLKREYRDGAIFVTSKDGSRNPAKKDEKKPAPEPRKEVDVF